MADLIVLSGNYIAGNVWHVFQREYRFISSAHSAGQG